MKSLNTYVQENLKFKINRDNDAYAYHPTTFDELRKIIEERFKELGPGTKDESINFNDIDVSGMTTFYNGLKNCGLFEYTNFEYIDLSNWDVSNVTDLYSMFDTCESLKSIGDISNWNVSNVKDMGDMFRNCENLKNVGDLSKWDISNIKNTDYMFKGSGITNIPDWYKE